MDIENMVELLADLVEGHNNVAAAILHALAEAIAEGAEEEIFELLRLWIEEHERKLRFLILKTTDL